MNATNKVLSAEPFKVLTENLMSQDLEVIWTLPQETD